ncbi:hypothetical protein QQ054_26090 [Oscillatoria amoena NRMC-F 0135]|nr:MAG: hypothetical protein F9K23_07305 [Bacteroidota bacterium]MDL5049492.1 hypothetical protein [Oscillatoria amoena NRMC-F 0135]
MTSIFHIKAEELNPDFLEALKKMFKGKNITLTVDVDIDETDYLLQNGANRDMLMASIKQVEDGETKSFSFSQIDEIG